MNPVRKSRFRLENNDVFGLDIGSSQVKLVELRKESKGWAVLAAGAAAVERADDGVTEGQLTGAIQKCVESSGVQTRFAVCGLSGPEVAVRHFKFPPMAEAELESAVMLEADQVCPFSVEKSTVDYQLVPDGEQSTRGVLVAATNELINSRQQLVKSASLNCVLMDV